MSSPVARRAAAPTKGRKPPPPWVLVAGGAVVIAGILGLSQCGGDDPTVAAPSPAATTASPTPSPKPTGTEIPNGPEATPTAPPSGQPTAAFPSQFGDGFWLVGTTPGPHTIAPVLYRVKNATTDCFWARVDKPTFPHPHIVQFSEHKGGRFEVTVQPTDKVFYTRDCGTWEHID